MSRSHRRTNVEFVVELMEYSAHGALIQAFVLEAIGRYARTVASRTPQELDTPLVSGRAWHGCAVEICEKLARWLDSDAAGANTAMHESAPGTAKGD